MPDRAEIDEVFGRQVAALAEAQSTWAAQADAGSGRDWYRPDPGVDTPPVSPGDSDKVAEAYSLDDLGTKFAAASDPDGEGTTGEVASLRYQIDYLRSLERAYRTRHLTGLRAELLSAARRRGLGASGTSGTVLRYAQDLLKAGQDGNS